MQKKSQKSAAADDDDFKNQPLGNARGLRGGMWPCWHQWTRTREGLGLEARGTDDHLGSLGLRHKRFVLEMEVRHGEKLNGNWSRGWRRRRGASCGLFFTFGMQASSRACPLQFYSKNSLISYGEIWTSLPSIFHVVYSSRSSNFRRFYFWS